MLRIYGCLNRIRQVYRGSNMSYAQNQPTATQQVTPDLKETTGAGPLVPTGANTPFSYSKVGRMATGSRLERIGYWIMVAAALALLLVLLKLFVGPFVSAAIIGFDIGLFVGLLTLMNLPRPSRWGNALLGRKVFPVLTAPDRDIWRLAWVNTTLVFGFTFMFTLLAAFLHPLLASIIVFGALIAAGVFYGRVRTVVIKP
jgi:hypothetical protein